MVKEAVWAFLGLDDSGNEIGPIAIRTPGSDEWYVFVTTDVRVLEKMQKSMQSIVKESGRRVRLVKFTQREILEELGANTANLN